jgi:hypothetical protein
MKRLSDEQVTLLKATIMKEFEFQKTMNKRYTSYGLKAIFERFLHIYIPNEDFKEVMEQLNIPSVPYQDGTDVFYPITEKSIRAADKKCKSFYWYE